jgi:hypothetical protein
VRSLLVFRRKVLREAVVVDKREASLSGIQQDWWDHSVRSHLNILHLRNTIHTGYKTGRNYEHGVKKWVKILVHAVVKACSCLIFTFNLNFQLVPDWLRGL